MRHRRIEERYHRSSPSHDRRRRSNSNNNYIILIIVAVVVSIIAVVGIAKACSNSSAKTDKMLDLSKYESRKLSGDETLRSSGEVVQSEHKSTHEVNALEKPAKLTDRTEIVLYKDNYIVSYNTQTFCPNYVAWHLTKERVNGDVPRSNNFHQDESLSEEFQVMTSDYSRSGFDRGHMCPAADNKNSYEAMEESFCMTNICPQDRYLNGGPWNDLEQLCRDWVRKYDDLYIVCGPIFDSQNPLKIGQPGRMMIWVPDRFFKVVLRMSEHPQAIAFIYNNSDEKQSVRTTVMSVDNVEEITGIDFYPILPDDIESAVEAKYQTNQWGI